MTTSKAKGGLVLPHLKIYYEATVLLTLLKHYSRGYQAAWKDIEDHDFQDKTFQEILWMSRWTRIKKFIPSPLCCTTLRVWDACQSAITMPD